MTYAEADVAKGVSTDGDLHPHICVIPNIAIGKANVYLIFAAKISPLITITINNRVYLTNIFKSKNGLSSGVGSAHAPPIKLANF